MLSVLYFCITMQHDLRLVALAAFICLFACFTASNLFGRAADTERGRKAIWLAGAAVVFGCGVWATHFVAELAYRPGMHVSYDPTLTALSAVIAVLLSGVGLALASEGGSALLGGAVVGLAVGAMHYTGIAAMRAPAVFQWNIPYVVASLAIGATLAAAAFAVPTRGGGLPSRFAATGLLVLAIVGLHFTGMGALTLVYDPMVEIPREATAPEFLAIAVAGMTAVIITIGLASAVADSRLARQATRQAAMLAGQVAEQTAALRQTQAELIRAERLSTMGQLTATVAHELRNPLSAVRNSLYVVRETLGEKAQTCERALDRAERNISRCDRIISDLLDYTRARELRRVALDPDELIDVCLARHKVPAEIALERRCGAAGLVASWDPERIGRIVANLVENAVQAVAEGAAKGAILVASSMERGDLVLAIADDGAGIPADVLPHVFEPLYSTKSFGTGLGLPAVKQIVEQHGGTVTIESVPGTGTTVTVRLPLQQSETLASAA